VTYFSDLSCLTIHGCEVVNIFARCGNHEGIFIQIYYLTNSQNVCKWSSNISIGLSMGFAVSVLCPRSQTHENREKRLPGGGSEMNRSGKIMIVCHCVLNANAKVIPLATVGGVFHEEISSCLDGGYGLFQLPCPELSYLGVNRWGMTKEQYDHPNFRAHCRDVLKYPFIQIQALVQAGYRLEGVLGMDGSPNCGVTLTCEGYEGGELCSTERVTSQSRSLRFVPGKGVFMEELVGMLGKIGIQPELFAIREKMDGF